MDREKMKQLNLTPIEDLIEEDFGKEGTPSRLEFENGCDAFIIGERLKEERLRAGLTQEQLASRIGTKKAYISRVENGHTDVQVSTLFKIFEGLGRRISINIQHQHIVTHSNKPTRHETGICPGIHNYARKQRREEKASRRSLKRDR